MSPRRWASGAAFALLLAVGGLRSVQAGECALEIKADDMLQFNTRVLKVEAGCATVTLTLRHVGQQAAHVLGHDWVLARSSDVAALAAAGVAAGYDRGYLPVNDPRVLAATRIVGGGEQATATFSTANLQSGVEYSFFCSFPGHIALMKGKLLLAGQSTTVASRK